MQKKRKEDFIKFMNLYNNLKGLIIQKGFKLQNIAQAIGLNRASLTRKLKTGRFTVDEINKLILILGKKEILKIFFQQDSAFMQ